MHLTNYAINKDGPGFIQNDAEKDTLGREGSKRSIRYILEWIDEQKPENCVDSKHVWEQIKDIIVKTVITAQPSLRKTIDACQQRIESNSSFMLPSDSEENQNLLYQPCFEILGFDILLDHKLKPWMLEVNHSPSFTCDSELDRRVKGAVIGDTLDMLDLPPEGTFDRHDSGTDIITLSTFQSSPPPTRPSTTNGWEIAYPPPQSTLSSSIKQSEYSSYIEAATTMFLNNDTELTKSRKAYREKLQQEKTNQNVKMAHIRERAKKLRDNARLGVSPARLVPMVQVEYPIRELKPKAVRNAMKITSIDLFLDYYTQKREV